MKCVKCGVDLTKTDDVCAACHEYDTEDYILVDSKPPRVVALETQNAEMLAMLRRVRANIKADGLNVDNHIFYRQIDELIKKVEKNK